MYRSVLHLERKRVFAVATALVISSTGSPRNLIGTGLDRDGVADVIAVRWISRKGPGIS